MAKISLGFVVGVVLAALVFILLDAAPNGTLSSKQAETPALSSNVRALPYAEDPQDDVPAPGPEVITDSVTRRDDEESLEARLLRQMEEAQRAANDYAEELQRIYTERERADNPILLPLPLPPEFDWLSEIPQITSYDRIQRELVDPEWAAGTEAQLASYFADRPEIVERYDYPAIQCRTTLCAVTFVAYGIDDAPYTTSEKWPSVVSDFADQPWAEQFLNTWPMSRNQDGVTTLFWTLQRRSSQ